MTGQVTLDSYSDAGIPAAVELVNELAPAGPVAEPPGRDRALSALARILAVDPPSVAQLGAGHVPGFLALARSLRQVFQEIDRSDVDAAAARLNGLLAKHPAHPHLAKEDGRWRLHHHPAEVALVPMWTSICAEAMARMLGGGHDGRFGTCAAPDCRRAFFDLSKNASRRFCSTTCQNRVKAAAFRQRRSDGRQRSSIMHARKRGSR
jgi:predicted RNA-binding Zn ribbon-like protein